MVQGPVPGPWAWPVWPCWPFLPPAWPCRTFLAPCEAMRPPCSYHSALMLPIPHTYPLFLGLRLQTVKFPGPLLGKLGQCVRDKRLQNTAGGPTGPHGAPWGPMGPHGAPWGPMGPRRPPLGPLGHRATLAPLPSGSPKGAQGALWGPQGAPWGPQGTPWAPLRGPRGPKGTLGAQL